MQFLTQHPSSSKFVEILKPDFFTTAENNTVFQIIQIFHKKTKAVPTLAEALELLRRELKARKDKITQDTLDSVEEAMRMAYDPFKGNYQYIQEILIEEYQLQLVSNLFKENASAIKDKEAGIITKVYREIEKIQKLSGRQFEEQESNRGEFLLADYRQGNYSVMQGKPTYLRGLNRMTAVGGFFAPQLIVFMMAPKGFKTGTCISIAVGYMKQGERVYYADTENDQMRIRDRARQAMVEATFSELVSGEHDSVLNQVVDKAKRLKGDFRCDFYPAKTKTMADVEAELEYLRDTYNWTPTVIIYDNLDNFKAVDNSIKDKRLQIQDVYFDAIRMQKRWSMIGFTPSQVNRNAVNKPIIDMKDFAEDFGKAANCHAAFALCQDDVEKVAKIGRIVPVVQRDGVDADSGACCYVEINKARMILAEITFEDWTNRYTDSVPEVEEKRKKLAKVEKNSYKGKPLKDD